MKTCSFFGHREVFDNVVPQLRHLIADLIENYGVNRFLVGNQGQFDRLVLRVLCELKSEYPNNCFYIVLAYLPSNNAISSDYASNTIFPENLEKTPPKYAILKRNRWIIEKSDYIITYVKHNTGGAATAKEFAEKSKKIVVNIPDIY